MSPSVPKPPVRMKERKPIPRQAKPKAANPARKKRNALRTYGEKAEWIRAQWCCACGIDGRSEAAHVGGGGTGYKGDSTMLVPLCGTRPTNQKLYGWYVEGCHAASHRIGIKTFEKKYNVDLKARAAEYEARWLAACALDSLTPL
jgi:hypothetical protein